jgi:heme exporter protein CcmD
MDWSAPHAGFVIAAYAASGICILGLIVWLVRRDVNARKQDSRLD